MVKSNAHGCKGEGACSLSTAHMRSLCTRGHTWLHDQPKVPRSDAYVVNQKSCRGCCCAAFALEVTRGCTINLKSRGQMLTSYLRRQPKELSRLLLDTLQALARFMSFMRGTSWTVG
jgi:hypothetical protein